MDLIIGTSAGHLRYFQNNGSASTPSFVEITGANAPFNGVDVGSDAAPAWTDVDKVSLSEPFCLPC